jgi:hypothetical protein
MNRYIVPHPYFERSDENLVMLQDLDNTIYYTPATQVSPKQRKNKPQPFHFSTVYPKRLTNG